MHYYRIFPSKSFALSHFPGGSFFPNTLPLICFSISPALVFQYWKLHFPKPQWLKRGRGRKKNYTNHYIYIANSVCYRKLFIYRKLNGEIFSYVFFFALSNSALWKCVYWARVRLPFCMTIETWAGVLLPKLLPFTFRPNRLLSIYHTFLWLLLLLFIPNSTLNPNRFSQFEENEWKK